jgi:TDG/mug DNA glycosylase family protein
MGQYYAHPQNHFWRILQAVWPALPQPDSYQGRLDWLLARGLGLWDVYAACEREGSLDTSIRHAVVNDFALACARRLPRLAAVAHNGGESWRHARHVSALGLPAHRLPVSTSPANASWSFERKLAAWARRVCPARVGVMARKNSHAIAARSQRVSDDGDTRYLHLGTEWVQGSMKLDEPYDIELEYVQRMMAWLLFVDPASVPSVTPCSWAWARVHHQVLPQEAAHVHHRHRAEPAGAGSVPQWFKLPPDGPKLRVVLGDAAEEMAHEPHVAGHGGCAGRWTCTTMRPPRPCSTAKTSMPTAAPADRRRHA